MKKKKNYYEILGISSNSSIADVKKAYKILAMKHHPDKGGNPETFKDINEAYAVLSDTSKKEKYDKYGSVDMEEINVNDIFQNIFGGGGPVNDIFNNPFFSPFQSSPFDSIKSSNDRHLDLKITLEEVMNGNTIYYKLSQKKFKTFSTCNQCNGNGKMIKQMNIGMGFMTQNISICPLCKGKGNLFDETIFEIEEHKIEIVIPSGIPEGAKIVVKNKADYYEGFDNGHVIFTIIYEPHKQYRISNDNHLDLIFPLTISLSQFIKGFDIQFTHLNGTIIHIYSTELLCDIISKPLIKKISSLGFSHNNHKGNLLIEFHIDMSSIPKSVVDFVSKDCHNQDQDTKSLYYDHEFNIRKLSWL